MVSSRFLVTAVLTFVGCTKAAYDGPLFDAMAQENAGKRNMDSLVELVRGAGVKKVAIFHRRPKSHPDGVSSLLTLRKKHPDLVVLGTPKFFRKAEEMTNEAVDGLPALVRQHHYSFVSEVQYKHARKTVVGSKERREDEDRVITPTSSSSHRLFKAIAPLSVPLIVHWEFYDFDEDYDAFTQLFEQFPDQIVIIPHAGFGEPEQVTKVLQRHPNVYVTLSKREETFSYFANIDRQGFGEGIIDLEGKLKAPWKELLTEHADHMMFATDAYKVFRWSRYREITERWRHILGQLPTPVAEQIAFRTAEKVYGVAIVATQTK